MVTAIEHQGLSDEDIATARELAEHGEHASNVTFRRLLGHIAVLQQSLDDALGPHCSSCGNAIDPDCCHCGSGPASLHHESHPFIPMGCVCGYHEQDWQQRANNLRERLWAAEERTEASIAAWLDDHDPAAADAIRSGAWRTQ